jgi:two-component sensor histidine kinase
LTNAGVALLYQDAELKVRWARNLPDIWRSDDLFGATDADYLPEPEATLIGDIKRQVLETGKQRTFGLRISGERPARWFDLWFDADIAADGSIIGVVTTMVETTERVRREQTLRTLLRDVSHRSKNLLAIIQSIATQTGRYSGTVDIFLRRFRGRLQSLASSQDLVTSSDWRGALLSELVAGQIDRYRENEAVGINLTGVDPHLDPNATLHIGLALHELLVNSMMHGALSRPGGRVDLHTELLDRETGRALVMEWREKLERPPPEEAPEKRFGSVALERVVPASLDGDATYEIGADRLTYRLEFPDSNFELV